MLVDKDVDNVSRKLQQIIYFFSNEWSGERVIDEIASAFKGGRMKEFPQQIGDFQGRSKSGALNSPFVNP